jgi:pimeloyl-ACP methyl ester carboxylesterase
MSALQISLLQHKFNVLAVDLRGHGCSTAASLAGGKWPLPASDILNIVAQAGLHRPWVFAHSIGATLALIAEAMHPGLWRGMALFEPMICGTPDQVRSPRRTVLHWAGAHTSNCPASTLDIARKALAGMTAIVPAS